MPPTMAPAASDSTARKPCDGTPITTTLAPSTASVIDDVATSDSGRRASARYVLFSASLVDLGRQGRTPRPQDRLCPTAATIAATVVPHDPAPITATLVPIDSPYRSSLRGGPGPAALRRPGGAGAAVDSAACGPRSSP